MCFWFCNTKEDNPDDIDSGYFRKRKKKEPTKVDAERCRNFEEKEFYVAWPKLIDIECVCRFFKVSSIVY